MSSPLRSTGNGAGHLGQHTLCDRAVALGSEMLSIGLVRQAAEIAVLQHDHLDAAGVQPLDDCGYVRAAIGPGTLSHIVAARLQDDYFCSVGHRACEPTEHASRRITVDAGILDAHAVSLPPQHRFELCRV